MSGDLRSCRRAARPRATTSHAHVGTRVRRGSSDRGAKLRVSGKAARAAAAARFSELAGHGATPAR